jgi:peptidyl-prolyl cis-trans isomerase SurA
MTRIATSQIRPLGALVFALALASVGGACRNTPGASATASADTWAVVDGREIKRDEVEKAYRRTLQPGATPSEEEALTTKLNLLNELIIQDILLANAAKLKIELPTTELDAAFAEGKKNIADEAFNKELASRTLTAADMRESLRRDLLAQKVIEKEVIAKATVSDQDVTDFYNANKAQFNRPEEAYHIAQIVVTPAQDQVNNRTGDDATSPQAAAGKIQMLMARLKEGVAFGDLAADFSEDPQTAQRGGDLGFVPVSALQNAPPALRDAVMKLTPGSANVVSGGGAHTIVLLVAKDAAGQKELSAVKEGISATLKERKQQLLRSAYIGVVRNDAVVVNHLARRLMQSNGKMPSLAPAKPGA